MQPGRHAVRRCWWQHGQPDWLGVQLSGLNALADASFTADGTQTVTYTPYTGATPVALTLKVNPPTLTGGQRDGGVEATLDVVIYNVAVLA